MQFSTLAVVFFAALATARSHGHGHRFQHRRYFNESAPVDLTTLTVQITSTHTVFNCAQNVTSCPAKDATATRTVTQVIDLTTTVCPVASASDVSSKVIASAGQNPTFVAPTVLTTDAAAAETGDTVLTYTLGTGTSQSVVTTTIRSTKTATAYTTKYMTIDRSAQESPVAGNPNNNNGNGSGNGNGNGNDNGYGEPTTTIRSTTTVTRIVTVHPASPSGSGSDSSIGVPNGGGNNANGNGNGGDCAAPVTVTVALSTVTVIYTPPAAASTVQSAPGSVDLGNNNVVKTTPVVDASTYIPVATVPADVGLGVTDEPEVVTSTNYVIPIPYTNTTEAATRRHSSGFIRSPRPTGTGSRIVPVPTGWF